MHRDYLDLLATHGEEKAARIIAGKKIEDYDLKAFWNLNKKKCSVSCWVSNIYLLFYGSATFINSLAVISFPYLSDITNEIPFIVQATFDNRVSGMLNKVKVVDLEHIRVSLALNNGLEFSYFFF